MILFSDEELELIERNVRSLTSLWLQRGKNTDEIIRHCAESMAMNTVRIREQNKLILDLVEPYRKRGANGTAQD